MFTGALCDTFERSNVQAGKICKFAPERLNHEQYKELDDVHGLKQDCVIKFARRRAAGEARHCESVCRLRRSNSSRTRKLNSLSVN